MRISDWSSDVCSSDLFEVVTAIEAWRAELLDNNPLSSTTQRLVHFGMTLAVGDATITADHARSAMRAGATLADLHGVCETAAVVLGMPGYTRGIAALREAMNEQRLGDRPSSPAAAECSKRPTIVRSPRHRSAARDRKSVG